MNGTEPKASSTLYTGAIRSDSGFTLRAIAFSSDFSESAEREPLRINIIIAPEYEFSVTARGEGSVTWNLPGSSFPPGRILELTATPAENWGFVKWTGDASGKNRVVEVVTQEREMEIQAVFGTNRYVEVFGAGSVRKTPPGPEPPGQVVVLQAVPDPGHYFVRWGERDVTVSPMTLMPYSNPAQMEQVWALFQLLEENQHPLTVLVDGPGMVTLSPARNFFTNGESVTLSASGSLRQRLRFSPWQRMGLFMFRMRV